MKTPVTCTTCHKPRFAEPPHAVPYVCRRCSAVGVIRKVVAPSPTPSAKRGDPFHSNDEHVREVNARANPHGGGWLPPRAEWLRRER